MKLNFNLIVRRSAAIVIKRLFKCQLGFQILIDKSLVGWMLLNILVNNDLTHRNGNISQLERQDELHVPETWFNPKLLESQCNDDDCGRE